MSKEVPAGVLEMLAIPGLRPDKVLKNLSRLLARRHLAFEHFAICTTCSICSTEVMRTHRSPQGLDRRGRAVWGPAQIVERGH
jgi:hypothetical protein